MAREGAHRRPEKKTTATRVEEAGLDGEGQKRLRRHSSSTSRRPLAQRRSNAAAPPASSSSPASTAAANESEREEEKVSGSLLGVVRVQLRDRRGFL
jgi:hypothetical protein